SKNKKKEYNMKDVLSQERMDKAMGTLGGGNHFIEVSRDDTGRYYLVIHTGSRYLGAKVATEYQKRANTLYTKNDTKELINKMKKEGRHQEIESELRKLKDKNKVYKGVRSEEHTSELQSRFDLVCRLLLEKKNKHG